MAKRLVLVRHAKSDYPVGVADHDRPLNPRGRRDAPAIAGWLQADGVLRDAVSPVVLVSSAVRTQQTWRAIAAELGPDWSDARVSTEPSIYEAPAARLRRVLLEAVDASDAMVVLVGHNPGVHDLVLELSAGSAVRDEAAARFPTSAVAVLATDLPWAKALGGWGTFEITSFGIPRG